MFIKLMFIQVTRKLNVCRCQLLWKSSSSPTSFQHTVFQSILVVNFTTSPKAMSHHYQLSNYAIHGLAHEFVIIGSLDMGFQ